MPDSSAGVMTPGELTALGGGLAHAHPTPTFSELDELGLIAALGPQPAPSPPRRASEVPVLPAPRPPRPLVTPLSTPGGGWLYAIVAPQISRVKIGYTVRPVGRRMRDLMGNQPPAEYWLHSATFHADVVRAERLVHLALTEERRHGEWFDLEAERVTRWLIQRELDTPANGLWDRVDGQL